MLCCEQAAAEAARRAVEDARHAEDVQVTSGAFSPHHESPGCNVSSSSMCAEEVRHTACLQEELCSGAGCGTW